MSPQMLAGMLQQHVQRYGPLPDRMRDDLDAALSGDVRAMLRVVCAVAAIEEARSEAGVGDAGGVSE